MAEAVQSAREAVAAREKELLADHGRAFGARRSASLEQDKARPSPRDYGVGAAAGQRGL